ncbi:NUDIX domain-containing protein [Clostridium sp. C2-6-12]|uniref:NUDIX domain-containing protein n=1 Tax=Clostridium sp. C2-6-12 TaxID=2698832 RepID=UPI0013681551|nr:NUDIX domain-containing protein [Clostridium sp. C2-6-12]
MSIRSTAKAIILNENQILLNKCFDEYHGSYYSLPGGGQDTYETLHEAVIRECLEETGYNVIPVRFSALYEEICENPKTIELYPEYIHKMYHIFICKLKNKETVSPTEIDDMQLKSEWINISDLKKIRIMPDFLNDNILEMIHSEVPKFYGADHIAYNHG